MFDELLLTPNTRKLLQNYINIDPDNAPSLVLAGEKGLGKCMVGEVLAQFLLSENAEPMDSHPDFLRIEPIEGVISKKQVDEVREYIGIRASSARRKVILVDDANLMGVVAANSLLKILEDGALTSVFIFIAHGKLIPTIMSRCAVIEFPVVETEALQHFLSTEGIDQFALMASGGKVGLYRTFSQSMKFHGIVCKMYMCLSNMENTRDILVQCHAVKEKDNQYIYEVFDVEERIGFFVFLQFIFRHHLIALSGSSEVESLKNLKRFYDMQQTLTILRCLEDTITLSIKKGKYTKNDFFELLMTLVSIERGD